MHATSLGFHVPAARAVPPPLPTVVTTQRDERRTFVPWWCAFPLYPGVALAGLFVVQFGMKNDHAHPHTHEERFLWQTNVFLNIVIVYLALQSVAPIAHHYAHTRLRSHVLDVGLFCDAFALWSIALASLLPVHFYVAAGDVPRPSHAAFVALYTALAVLLVANVLLLLRLLRRI